jgi:hypothetical protein
VKDGISCSACKTFTYTFQRSKVREVHANPLQ